MNVPDPRNDVNKARSPQSVMHSVGSFQDRLRLWNTRDDQTGSSHSDIVRYGRGHNPLAPYKQNSDGRVQARSFSFKKRKSYRFSGILPKHVTDSIHAETEDSSEDKELSLGQGSIENKRDHVSNETANSSETAQKNVVLAEAVSSNKDAHFQIINEPDDKSTNRIEKVSEKEERYQISKETANSSEMAQKIIVQAEIDSTNKDEHLQISDELNNKSKNRILGGGEKVPEIEAQHFKTSQKSPDAPTYERLSSAEDQLFERSQVSTCAPKEEVATRVFSQNFSDISSKSDESCISDNDPCDAADMPSEDRTKHILKQLEGASGNEYFDASTKTSEDAAKPISTQAKGASSTDSHLCALLEKTKVEFPIAQRRSSVTSTRSIPRRSDSVVFVGAPEEIPKLDKVPYPKEKMRQRRRESMNMRTARKRTKSIRANPLRELRQDFAPPIIPKDAQTIRMLEKSLRTNFVFERLDSPALQQLVQACEPTPQFDPNEIIIRENDTGDYFYILDSGEVTFEVDGKLVGTASQSGSSFGELALLYTCPRTATVRAKKPTRLWRLKQTVFRYVLQSHLRESEVSKYRLLKDSQFFSKLERADVKKCLNVMTPRRYKSGEYIVRKGDVGDAFYVVASGQLRVTDISTGNIDASNRDRKEEPKSEGVLLEKGDYFGERALIKSEPRSANVLGVKSGLLFRIDRKIFEKVCGSFIQLILKAQDKSLLADLEVTTAAKLDSEAINGLSLLLEDERYGEGQEVFAEGGLTRPALYLVREGQFEILRSNGMASIIKEGEVFGEDLLLADANGILTDQGMAEAKYSAVALEEGSTCGVLTLRDCHHVFDTKTIPDSKDLEREILMLMGLEKEEEEDDFRHLLLGRQVSVRSLLDKDDKDSLHQSFVRESILGEGQYGEVWEVSSSLKLFEDSNKFALKVQSKADTSRMSYTATEAIKRECEVLASVDHPFVVDLVHHYEDEENIYMVMGILRGGDLWAAIHKEVDGEWYSGMPEDTAKFYSLIVADTMDYLHRKSIVYRDLKPENVMIDEQGYPVLVDFGFAKVLEDGVTYTLCGTPQYISPEVATNSGHGFAVDNWALGVVIYETISGENPFWFDGMETLELFQDICREAPHPLPDDISAEAKDLVGRLLEKDPTQRLGSLAKGDREIKMHPWFDELDLHKARARQLEAPSIGFFGPSTNTIASSSTASS